MRTIPMKEDLIVEFKSYIKKYSDTDLIDEIVGMTNTKGGTLYLGVEDDGEITGVNPKHRKLAVWVLSNKNEGRTFWLDYCRNVKTGEKEKWSISHI